jgi:hypothetical protein
MADAPPFDPNRPFKAVEAPPFDPNKPFKAVEAAPPMSAGDQAADIAKSGGVGLVKGTIGLAGQPADYGPQSKAVGGWLGDKLGISPETQSKIGTGFDLARQTGVLGPIAALGTHTPGSETIRRGVESQAGPLYEPKTRAGRYTETAAGFVPTALLGPGGVARRIATQAVVPGIASEAAGEATAGTKYEPYARTAAAIAGGLPFGRWRQQPARPNAPAPISEELHAASNAQYKQVRDMDLRLKTSPISGIADAAENKITRDGLTRNNSPLTYAVIDRLKDLRRAPSGAFVSGSDFEASLQELRQAAFKGEGKAAWDTIEELNKYLKDIPASHVIQGDAKAASALFDQARGNWAAMKRLDMLGGKLDLGDLNAATAHSGMNKDNAIRQAVKQLIRPNKYGDTLAEKHGFSKREIAAMNEIARGTAPINTLRYIGNLLGGGGGLGQLLLGAGSMAAGYETGHPELMGLGFLGYGARKASGALTARQGRRLMEEVGRRSPEGQNVPMQPAQPSDAGQLLGVAGLRGLSGYGGPQ